MPVSVIMPVYNTKEEELRTAVESILNQTYADFEFIILNDASTNNAEDVIFSYADRRIRYLKNKTNLKLIESSNILLKETRYEYIARLDSDDYCVPERLEKQVKYLDEYPEIGVLGTFYEQIPADKFLPMPHMPDDVTLFTRYCGNCICHSSTMMRKTIIEKHNIRYDKKYLHAEDVKFWSDMSRYCKLALIPEILTYYRKSPDGISSQNSQYQSKMVMAIVFDNIINDFATDKKYMSAIMEKFVKGKPLTEEEFNRTNLFLVDVVNSLQKQISPPFNRLVRYYIMSILLYFLSYTS